MKITNPNSIGSAFLIYMMVIVLLITLIPFQFHIPEKISFRWHLSPTDFIRNIILFSPLGFAFKQSLGENKRPIRKVLLFGFLLSLFIELLQSFVLTRYTSGYDLIANTAGAFGGAVFFDFFSSRLRPQAEFKIPTLQIPLLFPVLMLMPLLWLTCLSAQHAPLKMYLLLPLGLFGIGLMYSIDVHRLSSVPYSPWRFVCISLLWFMISTLPAIIQSPEKAILIWIGMIGIVNLFHFIPERLNYAKDRRFEVSSLKRWCFVYVTYLLILILFPDATISEKGNGYNKMIAATTLVEFISAFTILGFIIFEIRGRLDKRPWKSSLIVIITCLAFLILATLFNNFSYVKAYDIVFFLAVIGAALYGGLIYRLQLKSLRR